MSFILEALRKSEQERARGQEQDLLQFPVATPTAAPALRPGVVLGLAALLLAGGIAIGWWKPWDRAAAPARSTAAPDTALSPAAVRPPAPAPGDSQPAAPARPAVSSPEASASPAPAPAARAAEAPQVPTRSEALKELRPLLPQGGSTAAPPPAPAPAKPSAVAAAPAAPAPAMLAPQAAAPAKPEAKTETQPAPKAEEKKPAAKPPPPKELPPPPDRVLAITELPPSLREGLPALAIRGFMYSDDSRSRVVVINDRMLQEGDEVAAELKLERIEPDGIVLNFRGYRFLAPK